MTITIGSCLDVMATLELNSLDSIVTDPPYHLTNNGGGPSSKGPHARARAGAARTGFMGKHWDGGDIAFRPETWAEALRIAKPGAFLAAFGGTRTFHRLACAIEDAGWELRDTLMWIYGSGFPKSHNGEWGGTALKPAWEPIVLARKPPEGTVEANWRKWGTGSLNIDGCRVGTEGTRRHTNHTMRGGNFENHVPSERIECGSDAGRWPANLLHDGDQMVLDLFPAEAGARSPVRGTEPSEVVANAYNDRERVPGAFHGDTGSAARFFYCAKASKSDREEGNNHPTVKPTDLMRWLCRLVTPPGGLVLDPFTGSGSTGKAARLEGLRFSGIELDPEYAAIAEARISAIAPTQ